jgi:hypothetical protein
MPNQHDMITEMHASIKVIENEIGHISKQAEKVDAVEDRVLILEQDKKWYKKIFVFVWGALGGGLIVFLRNMSKGN